MASKTSYDRSVSSSSTTSGNSINASIDSSFRDDPAYRGSLTSSELDSIHQTNSFKQATKLEKEDNHELAVKLKHVQQATKEPPKH